MHYHRLSVAVSVSLVSELLNKAFPLIILFVVAKRLGVEAFGTAQFGIGMIEAWVPFVLFGFHTRGTILLAKAWDDRVQVQRILSQTVSLKLLHAVLGSALMIGLTFLVPLWAPHRLLLCILSLFLFICAFDMVWVWIASQKMAALSLLITASKIPTLGLILALVQTPADAVLYAVLHLTANALVCLVTFLWTVRRFAFVRLSLTGAGELYRQALGPALGVVSIGVLDRIDIVVGEALMNPLAFGLYAGASRIVSSVTQVLAAVSSIFFSELVATKTAQDFRQHVALALATLFTCAAVCAGILAMFSAPLVGFVLGERFAGAASDLQTLALTLPATSLMLVFGSQVLIIRDRSRDLAVSAAMGIALIVFWAWWTQGSWPKGIGYPGLILAGKWIVGLGCVAFAVRQLRR